jgi:hypothetical protein
MRPDHAPPTPTLPLLVAFAIPLVVTCALCWPLPIRPGSHWCPTLFGASHAWTLEHLWQALTQGEPLHHTLRAGYPWERSARFIGWLPMLAALPLRAVLGPIVAFQLALLLALPLSSLAAWPLLRRWGGAGPWVTAAGCVSFALCPFALGTLSSGELPKLCVGLVPLFLFALDRARCQERGLGWTLAAAALATVTAFTSPSFGLFLPLMALGLLGWDAWHHRRLLRPLGCGAAVAAALLPALLYYRGLEGHVWRSLHMPAQSFGLQAQLPSPHPSASLLDLLIGLPAEVSGPWSMRHVAYLGSATIALLALLAWRNGRRPGRSAAIALLIAGGLLALGPQLYPVENLSRIPMPAVLLSWLRYPLARSGMFYRLALLGSLGLALWLVVEAARRPRLVWLLLLVQLADSVRASGPWPLEVQPIPGYGLLKSLKGADGAVLDLPYGGGLVPSQQALLLATLHGRPTTALPRMFLPSEQAVLRPLWARALDGEDPVATLGALGIRYVVSSNGDPRLEAKTEARLGPPSQRRGSLTIWDLGPTTLVPRPAAQLEPRRAPAGQPPREPARGKAGTQPSPPRP